MPSVEIDIESGLEKGEFLADAADIIVSEIDFKLRKKGKNPFPDRSDFVSEAVENFEAVSPGKLTFDSINGFSAFIINIIAVEPAEKSLFEQKYDLIEDKSINKKIIVLDDESLFNDVSSTSLIKSNAALNSTSCNLP